MELSQAAARALMRLRPVSLYTSPLSRPQPSLLSLRSFTTSRLLRQEHQQPEAFMRQVKDQAERQSDISNPTSPADTPAQPAQQTKPFNSMLDNALDGDKGVPTTSEARTSRFASNSAQQDNRVQPSSSTADLFNDFIDTSRAAQKTPRPSPLSAAGTSFSDFRSNVRSPSRNAFGDFLGGAFSKNIKEVEPLNFTPGPTLGKTVDVGPNGDVGRAFRQVEALCSRNKVRYDFNKQRFHERPGLKRKRLHSERWRRRFKEAFRGTVKLVTKMRKQGW